MYSTIAVEKRGAVVWLTLNRPDVRNSINVELAVEVAAAMNDFARDPGVRAVVLGGAGKVFCAGGDLGSKAITADPELLEEQRRDGLAFMEQAITPLIRAIYHCPKPVVAAVHGHAVGAGIGLALAADVVIAARSAHFMPRFVPSVALIPDLGSTWTLARAVGRPRATAIMMLGADVSAEQAEQWGMIWRAVPDDEFAAVVESIATQLSSGPGFAQAAFKHVLDRSWCVDFDAQIVREGEISARCTATPDFVEAVAAFQERRAPSFGGLDTAAYRELGTLYDGGSGSR